MDAATHRTVVQRASDCCEYCRLPQAATPYFSFHVEHIHAQQHVDDDSLDNLALACPDCNRFKGPNLTTMIPETREIIALFHPRQNRWEEHFEFRGALIVGRTDTGRATARLLNMNSDERVAMRAELMESGLM
jgi:hypothetical protein